MPHLTEAKPSGEVTAISLPAEALQTSLAVPVRSSVPDLVELELEPGPALGESHRLGATQLFKCVVAEGDEVAVVAERDHPLAGLLRGTRRQRQQLLRACVLLSAQTGGRVETEVLVGAELQRPPSTAARCAASPRVT